MGGKPTTFAGSDQGFRAPVVCRQREQGAARRDRSTGSRSMSATRTRRTAARRCRR
jgi:hypothetical protein